MIKIFIKKKKKKVCNSGQNIVKKVLLKDEDA